MFEQVSTQEVLQYVGGTVAGAVLYVIAWKGDQRQGLEDANQPGNTLTRTKQNLYATAVGTAAVEGVHDGVQYLAGEPIPDLLYDDVFTLAGVGTGFTAMREVHRRVARSYDLDDVDEMLEE